MLEFEVAISLGGPLVAPRQASPATPYLALNGSGAPDRQKDPQIALGNPDDTPKPMHHKVAGLDPAPDGAGRNAETIGDVSDRRKMS
jgi:hypothetical protein